MPDALKHLDVCTALNSSPRDCVLQSIRLIEPLSYIDLTSELSISTEKQA